MATAPTAARVISKDGNVSTGWVINGQTFKDQQGNQRIDSGSTVELNDGRSWVYNDKTGGVPTAQTARNEFKNNLNYGNYDSALNTMQSGINSRVSAQQAAYNRQADKIRRDAELAKKEAREAYIQASNPYGPIGQRLEALGLGDSGYAETTYTRLGNQYQKLLSDQARATEDALAGIYGDIEAAYAQADYDRAMAAANIMLQKDSAMRSDNQFLANWDMNNYQNAVENNRYDQQRQDQLDRYAIEDARVAKQDLEDWGWNMLAAGNVSQQVADALGIPLVTLQQMGAYMNTPTVSRSGGSSGGSSGGKNEKWTPESEKKALDDIVNNMLSIRDDVAAENYLSKQKLSDEVKQELSDRYERAKTQNIQNIINPVHNTIKMEGITNTDTIENMYLQHIRAAYLGGKISESEMNKLLNEYAPNVTK